MAAAIQLERAVAIDLFSGKVFSMTLETGSWKDMMSHKAGTVADGKIVTTQRETVRGKVLSSESVHNCRLQWLDGSQSTLDLQGNYSIGDQVVCVLFRDELHLAAANLTTNQRLLYHDKINAVMKFSAARFPQRVIFGVVLGAMVGGFYLLNGGALDISLNSTPAMGALLLAVFALLLVLWWFNRSSNDRRKLVSGIDAEIDAGRRQLARRTTA